MNHIFYHVAHIYIDSAHIYTHSLGSAEQLLCIFYCYLIQCASRNVYFHHTFIFCYVIFHLAVLTFDSGIPLCAQHFKLYSFSFQVAHLPSRAFRLSGVHFFVISGFLMQWSSSSSGHFVKDFKTRVFKGSISQIRNFIY